MKHREIKYKFREKKPDGNSPGTVKNTVMAPHVNEGKIEPYVTVLRKCCLSSEGFDQWMKKSDIAGN
jgi:hypothetical protein